MTDAKIIRRLFKTDPAAARRLLSMWSTLATISHTNTSLPPESYRAMARAELAKGNKKETRRGR